MTCERRGGRGVDRGEDGKLETGSSTGVVVTFCPGMQRLAPQEVLCNFIIWEIVPLKVR